MEGKMQATLSLPIFSILIRNSGAQNSEVPLQEVPLDVLKIRKLNYVLILQKMSLPSLFTLRCFPISINQSFLKIELVPLYVARLAYNQNKISQSSKNSYIMYTTAYSGFKNVCFCSTQDKWEWNLKFTYPPFKLNGLRTTYPRIPFHRHWKQSEFAEYFSTTIFEQTVS